MGQPAKTSRAASSRSTGFSTLVWCTSGLLVLAAIASAIIWLPPYLATSKTLSAKDLALLTPAEKAENVAAARQAVAICVAAILAALAAAAGVLINSRTVKVTRTGQVEIENRYEDEKVRAQANQVAARYQEATTQLGHDQAAVRLAGAYSLIRLADEQDAWRATCVKVLCAYLRMEITTPSEERVREAVMEEIAQRVKTEGDPRVSWSDFELNFDGAPLPPVSFRDCTIERLSIEGATVRNRLTLANVQIMAGLDARRLNVEGRVFIGTIGPGAINVHRAHIFEGGKLTISHEPLAPSVGKPRHSVLAKGVVVDGPGEFRLIASRSFSRDDFWGEAMVLRGGLLTIEAADGVPALNSVKLNRLDRGSSGILRVSHEMHQVVTGKPVGNSDMHVGMNPPPGHPKSIYSCRC